MPIVTVEDLNTYLGETGTTDKKIAVCRAASSYIRRVTGCRWGLARYCEWRFLHGASEVYLRPDVDTVVAAAAGTRPALRLRWPGPQLGVNAQVVVMPMLERDETLVSSRLGLVPHTDDNPTEQRLLVLEDYLTMPELKQQIEMLGWSCEVLGDGEPQRLKPTLSGDAAARHIELELPGDVIELSIPSPSMGRVRLPHRYSGWLFVDYVSGMQPPRELVQVGVELAAYWMSVSQINTAVQSERIGDYSYTLSSSSGSLGGVSGGRMEDFEQRLAPYRKVTL